MQLLFDDEGRRWLIAPTASASGSRTRAAGEVELTRALRTRRYRIEEVQGQEAAPILREYLRSTPIVKPYFDLDADAPLEAFEAETPRCLRYVPVARQRSAGFGVFLGSC